MDSNNFERAIEVLNRLEQNQLVERYAIGGAVGTMFYTEPFLTEDVDVFVVVPQDRENSLNPLTDIYGYLAGAGYSIEGLYLRIEGVLIQFIIASDKLFKEALNEALEVPFGKTRTRVLTPEYLLTLMINAGRPRDFAKIALLIDQVEIDQNKLNDILLRHKLTEKWARFKKKEQ